MKRHGMHEYEISLTNEDGERYRRTRERGSNDRHFQLKLHKIFKHEKRGKCHLV